LLNYLIFFFPCRSHDVLMFLTGQEEIEQLASKIRQIVKVSILSSKEKKKNPLKSLNFNLQTMKEGPAMRVCTLYAAMPPQKQLEVFQPIAPNARKVIISTNIAETSLTITGIKFVIDCGMVKAKYHQPTTGMDVLKIERISQAQALQRCGRAGRESEGVCYRTYTLTDFKAMPVSAVPEILRCNIAAVILQLLGMDIDCRKFDFMDVPSAEAIESALKELKLLGAIKETTGVGITELGRKMAKFPLDPKYSKLILSAPEFGCLDEMLCLVALLSGENIFQSSIDKREEMMTAHAKFCSEYGDHLTLLNVFKSFEKTDKLKVITLCKVFCKLIA
jgi:ATP-dependent RNA helicase DHX33